MLKRDILYLLGVKNRFILKNQATQSLIHNELRGTNKSLKTDIPCR